MSPLLRRRQNHGQAGPGIVGIRQPQINAAIAENDIRDVRSGKGGAHLTTADGKADRAAADGGTGYDFMSWGGEADSQFAILGVPTVIAVIAEVGMRRFMQVCHGGPFITKCREFRDTTRTSEWFGPPAS